jgi:hypothetical protein
MPGEQMRMLFVRHVELAASLGMLFDSLWEHVTSNFRQDVNFDGTLNSADISLSLVKSKSGTALP